MPIIERMKEHVRSQYEDQMAASANEESKECSPTDEAIVQMLI